MSKFSIKNRVKSFQFAFKGIFTLFKDEPNAWIHLAAVISVIILGFSFEISSFEWVIIILCFGLILGAEAFNSSIEALADKVEPNIDPLIKKTKDLSAAAVLFLSIASAIIGCIIFLPKFF